MPLSLSLPIFLTLSPFCKDEKGPGLFTNISKLSHRSSDHGLQFYSDVGVRWYGCRAMMLKTVAAVPSVVTKVETISPPWDFVDTRKSKLRSSKFIS